MAEICGMMDWVRLSVTKESRIKKRQILILLGLVYFLFGLLLGGCYQGLAGIPAEELGGFANFMAGYHRIAIPPVIDNVAASLILQLECGVAWPLILFVVLFGWVTSSFFSFFIFIILFIAFRRLL
ncbi:MAG: hypothetical protein PHC85_02020 [Candidatus Pacebacteria bacterium]|nr:hypothetical protein [Candidatus Paceibacterota bacterium]